MKNILLALLGIGVVLFLIKSSLVPVEDKDYVKESKQDLFKLKASWQDSEDLTHKDMLVQQMCEITSRMPDSHKKAEPFLDENCI